MTSFDTPGEMPVNLDNVREMLGNDPEREKELYGIFFVSAEENINIMHASCAQGAEESWRTQAHALKGMSLNLGAAKLGEICATAQKNHTALQPEKEKMLAEIKAEYARVKEFIERQQS